MNNTDKLLKEMKDWLMLPPNENFTIAECFRVANSNDQWQVNMFYTTFAPYMANLLDDIHAEELIKGFINE